MFLCLNMKLPLLSPNLSSEPFSLLLKNCMKVKALKPCKQVHALLLASGANLNSFSLNSKLVGLYASCGDLGSAELIFQETQNPNVFAFNWMISAMAFDGYFERAIEYYSLLQVSKSYANKYTFSIVLKACVGLLDLNKGKQIHCMMQKVGFESKVSVCNALIDMYCKCGNLENGRQVFDEMVERDVVSWTSMISGYSSKGKTEDMNILFKQMKLEGLEPNDFTWNAMTAGYARRGDRDGAFETLSRMISEERSPGLVTWNGVISGLVQGQCYDEALEVFGSMLMAGIRPNQVTVTGLLPACGLMASTRRGKEIHGLLYRMELYANVFIASALIDMYSKCGNVGYGWNVFNKMPVKNVASWNAMIGCYGKHGMVDSAITLFEKMEDEGIRANEVTLICVLSACGHGGLVEKGLAIFRSMRERYRVEASQEHYACVVDLLCRAGRVEEAYAMVKEMQMGLTDSIIGAFFSGCKIHERRDLARKMSEDILSMDLKKPGGLVALSNIYAAEGEWEEVENVRKVMKQKGVQKRPGSSWVDKKDDFSEPEFGEESK